MAYVDPSALVPIALGEQPEATRIRLVQLYSCFSEDTHCAGWLMDPWQPHVKRAFTDWLRRNVVHPESVRPLEDYEQAALETLRECWADAHADTSALLAVTLEEPTVWTTGSDQ